MLHESHATLKLLEGGFGNLKVLIVGDIMLDRYIHGEVERISPEAPVPVLRHAQMSGRAALRTLRMNPCRTWLSGISGRAVGS